MVGDVNIYKSNSFYSYNNNNENGRFEVKLLFIKYIILWYYFYKSCEMVCQVVSKEFFSCFKYTTISLTYKESEI